jgi:hypothetical protein
MGEGLEKIEGHCRDFRLLWSNFEIMARAVMDIGGRVVIEWPERCKYWTENPVMRFVKQHDFVDSIFHGCAYGLVAKHNLPIGPPMKNPGGAVAMTPSCYRSSTGNVRVDMTMRNAEVVIARRPKIIRLLSSTLSIRASCDVADHPMGSLLGNAPTTPCKL